MDFLIPVQKLTCITKCLCETAKFYQIIQMKEKFRNTYSEMHFIYKDELLFLYYNVSEAFHIWMKSVNGQYKLRYHFMCHNGSFSRKFLHFLFSLFIMDSPVLLAIHYLSQTHVPLQRSPVISLSFSLSFFALSTTHLSYKIPSLFRLWKL